ncbi:MAG: hypothetical protein ABSF21_00205 [Dehalococcoidia bacterium]
MAEKVDYWISNAVGAFFDPIIVMPGGWGDSLPEAIKTQITLERLIMNIQGLQGDQMTGTDAEAAAYLYTASLTAPMGDHWVNIYMYVFNQVMKHQKIEVPDDLKVETLGNYEMGMLRDLKAWIYRKRVEARQQRDREERRGKNNKAKNNPQQNTFHEDKYKQDPIF